MTVKLRSQEVSGCQTFLQQPFGLRRSSRFLPEPRIKRACAQAMRTRKFKNFKSASNHARSLQRRIKVARRLQSRFGKASLLSRRDEGQILGATESADDARPSRNTPGSKVLLSRALVKAAFARGLAEGAKSTGFTQRTAGTPACPYHKGRTPFSHTQVDF